MNWNHRVMKRSDGEYGIVEVYYSSADDRIVAWTADFISPWGENVEDLIWNLEEMIKACSLPVLDENELESKLNSVKEN